MSQLIEQLAKNDFNITQLIIIDSNGNQITKPYRLKNGANNFKCIALYTDGISAEFSPYWTCPIILNHREVVDGRLQSSVEIDAWGVLGNSKKAEVTINAAPNHQKYTQLACWVFPPKKVKQTRNAEIPHDSTGFDYSDIA